jgi:3-dehydroquinate synthase
VAVIRVLLGDAPDRSYDVVCGSGVLAGIGEAMRRSRADRAVLVCDAAVEATHAQTAAASLSAAGIRPVTTRIPSGETAKSVAEVARLWDEFARLGVDRGTHVVAVGGGVVGDLAGFAAASFMRGLPFWQVPTTLVAQVDSSVGGKTGINLEAGKNLVGCFWQPCGVFADIDTLATLPRREFVSGLAEVVKYGMILDPGFFAWLEDRAEQVLARDPAALTHVVTRSVQLKADVVAADERETSGARAALNYGHTFGHAFEAVAGYGRLLHGEAVALGMARAARLAAALGRIPREVVARQDRLLERLGLPISPGILAPPPPTSALLDAMQRDKKTLGGQLRFVLPHRIGAVELVDGVSPDDVRRVLETAG